MKTLLKLGAIAVLVAAVVNPVLGHRMLDAAHGAVSSFTSKITSELDGHKVTVVASDPVGDVPKAQVAPPQEAVVPAGPGYKFTTVTNGEPARWDPCTVHDIEVNQTGAPANAMQDLKASVAKLNKASGMKFRVAGTTARKATDDWNATFTDGKWQPILVAWSKPGTGTLAPKGEIGKTYVASIDTEAGPEQIVSAQVVFTSSTKGITPGFKSGEVSQGALMLHELGHMAGLDHVTNTTDIMFPEIGRAGTYASGDLAGLAQLGTKAGCLTG